jgi:hypothetical protein
MRGWNGKGRRGSGVGAERRSARGGIVTAHGCLVGEVGGWYDPVVLRRMGGGRGEIRSSF